MSGVPKYVVSTTLKDQDLSWENSHLISKNVGDEVRKLKEQPGQYILVGGSGQLVRTLMQEDLVDEYRLMVHPIVVGGGKRFFADGIDRKVLELAESQPIAAGVVVLVYRPAGNDA